MGTVAIDVGDFLGHRQYQRELDELANVRCENCKYLGKRAEGEEYHLCEHPERQPDCRVILSGRPNHRISCGLFAHKRGVFGRLETLEHLRKSGNLTYNDVIKVVSELGLTLAGYGDGADYSEAESHCYWNASGQMRDPPAIYVEYDFDAADKNGRKTLAGTVRFLDIDARATGEDIFDKLKSGEEIGKYQFIQACILAAIPVPARVRIAIVRRVLGYKTIYEEYDNVLAVRACFRRLGRRKMSKKIWELGDELARIAAGIEVGV